MAAEDSPLRSNVIVFLSTKGKGQFFTVEQLYEVLGVSTRSPALTLDGFRAFLEDMAQRNLIRRWRANPMGGKGDVFTAG